MITIDAKSTTFLNDVKTIRQSSKMNADQIRHVDAILDSVRNRGDKAVIDYAKKFDGVELTTDEFRVTPDEIDQASEILSRNAKSAIDRAYENISIFSRQRIPENWSFSPRDGVCLGEKFVPFSRIGAYIPGGTAPLASTVIHTLGIAKVAGVHDVVLTTPVGPSKKVHPAIIYAATVSGATEIYRLGGVYAIGALAFGTESIKKVEKIVGPGNAYVAAAKQRVYGQVALDLVAGPSEVLIIADGDANPVFIAADMLAQAEHGSGAEIAILVTDSDEIITGVQQGLVDQCRMLGRRKEIQQVIDNGTFFIKVRGIEEAIAVANELACEHIEILTEKPAAVAEKITSAGAIFLGAWTPEAVGDYIAGPSHVLPTSGTAHCFSGLTVNDFFRRISVVEYGKQALARESEPIREFSRMEELDAHGQAVQIRFDGN